MTSYKVSVTSIELQVARTGDKVQEKSEKVKVERLGWQVASDRW